jgi:hypothetical protein
MRFVFRFRDYDELLLFGCWWRCYDRGWWKRLRFNVNTGHLFRLVLRLL